MTYDVHGSVWLDGQWMRRSPWRHRITVGAISPVFPLLRSLYFLPSYPAMSEERGLPLDRAEAASIRRDCSGAWCWQGTSPWARAFVALHMYCIGVGGVLATSNPRVLYCGSWGNRLRSGVSMTGNGGPSFMRSKKVASAEVTSHQKKPIAWKVA